MKIIATQRRTFRNVNKICTFAYILTLFALINVIRLNSTKAINCLSSCVSTPRQMYMLINSTMYSAEVKTTTQTSVGLQTKIITKE